MKLQIDFDKKTIKIEDTVNLGTLVEKLTEMFPDWKDYTLLVNTKIEWHTYPIYRPYWSYNTFDTVIGTITNTNNKNIYVAPNNNLTKDLSITNAIPNLTANNSILNVEI